MHSRKIKIGGFSHVESVTLGGGLLPVIQTMWKERLSFSDFEGEAGKALVARIEGLKKMGCGLLRFAVPNLNAAEVLGKLASMVSMPLVADIHNDHNIALRCLDFPIAKIRINPGNIGDKAKVEQVVNKAKANSRPIRIGVNAGSLPTDIRQRVDSGLLDSAEALVLTAEREIAEFDDLGFSDVMVSMKASSVADNIKANRIFAERSDVPLHVGVTEAGPLIAGVVRNAAALITLLGEGIGDTIRVSLSDTMKNEVIAAREILDTVQEMKGEAPRLGVRIVSCPRCARYSFDTHAFTERWLDMLYAMEKNITVAIMGCDINGPQEARHADIGITGVGNRVLIFSKGEKKRTIDASEADAAFEEELRRL
jgi:(E)-4-hydroxy-3-methylbut-2-enyl-diphosphate synthase